MATNLPANFQGLLGALENTAQRMASAGTGDAEFIKLTKQGLWVYGAEEVDVEEGSKWAINPMSLRLGYVCWGDGEVIDEAMALITDPPIVKSNLPVHAKPWNEQIGLDMVCLSGEDKGTHVRYTATSLGGRKAFKDLINTVIGRAREGRAELVPVVTLEVESYKHKTYGKIFTPELQIVEWGNMDSLETVPAGAAPALAKSEPEPEPVAEPTRRRRRRSAA